MSHEPLISEFVKRMRLAGGDNLVSIVLYGSGAEGEFHHEYSDLNLLCVLRDASFVPLDRLADVADWWRKKKHRAPLILTAQDITDSADVFSIEFLDMKQRYRVLDGEDVLCNLDIPMELHRRQLEYELREKLFLLRQHIVIATRNEKQLWEIMLQSLSSITTLIRHVLVEMGESGRKHSCDAVQELASRLNFDGSAFVQLMDVRARKIERKQLGAGDLAQRYLSAIEKITDAVDKMLSLPRQSNQ